MTFTFGKSGVAIHLFKMGDIGVGKTKLQGTLANNGISFGIDGYYNKANQSSHLTVESGGEDWLEDLGLDITDFYTWVDLNI